MKKLEAMAIVFKMNMGDVGKTLEEKDVQYALRAALHWVADAEPSDTAASAMESVDLLDTSAEGRWEVARAAIKAIAEDNTL